MAVCKYRSKTMMTSTLSYIYYDAAEFSLEAMLIFSCVQIEKEH